MYLEDNIFKVAWGIVGQHYGRHILQISPIDVHYVEAGLALAQPFAHWSRLPTNELAADIEYAVSEYLGQQYGVNYMRPFCCTEFAERLVECLINQ